MLHHGIWKPYTHRKRLSLESNYYLFCINAFALKFCEIAWEQPISANIGGYRYHLINFISLYNIQER